MQNMHFTHDVPRPLGGTDAWVIVGVVASGNLEVLAERTGSPERCDVHVATAVTGFDDVWADVVRDVVTRLSPGGIVLSVNDGGARPDMVALRLAQAIRALRGENHD